MKQYKFYFAVFLTLINLCFTAKAQTDLPVIYQTFVRENPGVEGGQIAILNAQTLEQVGKIAITPANPEVITLSKDRRRAFVLHSPIIIGEQGLTVVDLEQSLNQQVVKTILFEDKILYGVRLATDGMLWVLLEEDSQVAIVNASTLQVIKTIQLPEPARDVIFSQNGQKAYVSLLNKAVLEVNINENHRISRTISTLPERNKSQVRPFELEISSDGNALFVSGEDNVSIVNTTSFITETIPLPISRSSFLLKLTPNGKFLYAVGSLGAQFVVINLENRDIKTFRTPATTGIQTALNISPDGRLAYISGFYGISVFDVEKQVFIKNLLTSTGIGFPNPFSLGLTISGDFSVGQAPTLSTISPTGGDNILANQSTTINWATTVTPQSYSLASHKIELSTDNGQTFSLIPGAEELPGDARSFTWNVPNIESLTAKIRVSTVDLGARRTSSTTGTFGILRSLPGDINAPTVNFISPVGNEVFNTGSNLAITWTSSDNVGVVSQDLSLSTDGGQTFTTNLASGLPGSTQSFNFAIPQSLTTTQARLRLVVRDAVGNMSQAVTASNFSIQTAVDNIAPTVTISQPTTNSNLVAGGPIQVNWTSTDNRAVVSQSLLLSLNGGQSFTQVASFGANDSNFLLNNINGLSLTTPQAIVRITATDQAGNTGQSNSTFIISPMLSMSSYAAKLLTINGIGFMSNGNNNNVQIFINGKLTNVAPKTLTNTALTLKGNKKKLNLSKGANTVKVVVDGVMSNESSFNF